MGGEDPPALLGEEKDAIWVRARIIGASATRKDRRVAEKYITKMAKVKRLEPHEDSEIPLFEAPINGPIVNFTFAPSEELQAVRRLERLCLKGPEPA
jgi:hypothetical protein